MVTGDDQLGVSGDRAFKNAVVSVVGEDLHSSARSDTPQLALSIRATLS